MIKASATTEQISRGQIGQPAACMIENKAFSREAAAAAAREIMSEAAGASAAPPGRWRTVHLFCGQLCGQPACIARKPAPIRAPAWIARIFSSGFSLEINHLHDFDVLVTTSMPVPACIGALVEFRGRANAGPAA
jgi:hypothetical protein